MLGRKEKDTADAVNADKEEEKSFGSSVLSFFKELLIIIVIALAISAFVQNIFARVYVIPSGSMIPTLQVGDRILVDKMTYRSSDPKPGDVVVFKGPDSWNESFESNRSDNSFVRAMQNTGTFFGLVPPDENDLVKRVIAEGGQSARCQPGDKGVTVDDHVINSSYILYPPFIDWGGNPNGSNACGGPYFGPVTVPKGFMWVMGDNRTDSADSRYHMQDQYHGTVPISNVRGKVQSIIWPAGRWHKVKSQPLPQPK